MTVKVSHPRKINSSNKIKSLCCVELVNLQLNQLREPSPALKLNTDYTYFHPLLYTSSTLNLRFHLAHSTAEDHF